MRKRTPPRPPRRDPRALSRKASPTRREIARLLRGGVDLRKLARGLVRSVGPGPRAYEPLAWGDARRAGGFTRAMCASARHRRTARAQVFEAAWDRNASAHPPLRRRGPCLCRARTRRVARNSQILSALRA